MVFWIAQFFGLLGLFLMVISLFKSEKQEMLLFVILNGLSFSLEYFLLGAFSGMGSNLFGILRTMICMQKEKNIRYDKKWILVLIMIVYVLIGAYSYTGPITVLPIIAEEIYVLTIWQSKVPVIRYGTALMVILWFIYDIIVAAYPSAACDTIVFFSTVTSILINRKGKTEEGGIRDR